MAAMVENGYLNGANGRLNPQADMTRAEFAQLMGNIVLIILMQTARREKH